MSGIYIPDVGLPQDGDFELWISIKKDGSYNYNISGGWNEGKRKVIPVPPHGRLIDVDSAMKAACKALCHPGVLCPDFLCKEVREKFDAVSTIIPAEEAE